MYLSILTRTSLRQTMGQYCYFLMEFWPLIDVRVVILLKIFRNSWWIFIIFFKYTLILTNRVADISACDICLWWQGVMLCGAFVCFYTLLLGSGRVILFHVGHPCNHLSVCNSSISMFLFLDDNLSKCQWIFTKLSTVDSRYLDPSYLDPITYVELISKSRLFSLCIYCISASRMSTTFMSTYFYVDTSAISSIIFSPWIYFSLFLLPSISNSDHDEGKKNVRCGAAGLSVNENHNRPLINKSIF